MYLKLQLLKTTELEERRVKLMAEAAEKQNARIILRSLSFDNLVL
jgi:hypothetical protein